MDELEDGDGFDEIEKASTRRTIDEEFEASDRKLPRINKTGPGSPVTASKIKKLEDRRWTDHLVEPQEERDVIRRAKDGNPEARHRLYRCYHKALIKIAGSVKYGGPPFGDRLSAASTGFWKAVKRYNLNRHNGFYAYAIKFIEGAVVDCVHDWHQCGGKLETREERENRKNGQGFRPIYVQYNSIEKRRDEDGADADGDANGKPITGLIEPDDAELRECDGSGGQVTDADWAKIVAGRAVPTNYPPNEYGPQPCKPISRSRYEEDQARAYRFDTAAFVRQRITGWLAPIERNLGVPRECIGVDENPNRNGGRYPKKIIGSPGFQIPRASFRCEHPLPQREYLKQNPTPKQYQADPSRIRGNASPLGIVGHLAKDAEAGAKRRLAQVGRRLYAQQLAAKDRDTAEHRPLQRHIYEGAVPKPNQFRKSKYSPLTKAHLKEIREAKPRRDTAMFNATGVQSGWQMRGDAPPDHTLVRTISWEQHTQNAKRRMNALIVAVDNGVENGTIKYNNAVQLGGGVHRADRGDRHDIRTVRRTAGKSSA